MTLNIKIENPEDGGPYEARVREMSLSPNGERHLQNLIVLKPGETHEACIHDGVMVEVTEGDEVKGTG